MQGAQATRREETVLAVASALRGELYAGAWRFGEDGGIARLFGPGTVGEAGFEQLPAADLICGEGPPEVIAGLSGRLGCVVVGPPRAWPRAATLLSLVTVSGGATRVAEPAEWEPVYGRPAEAQDQWELRHGRPLPDPRRHDG